VRGQGGEGKRAVEYSRKKLDLTGEQYRRLTVVGPAPNIGGRTAWRCRCACGRETVVKTCYLRSGHTGSCGQCVKHGVTGLTYVDGTCVEQLRAKTVRKNNTSGVPGVDWRASIGLWRAMICFKGKRHYLGSFRRFEDAVKARKRAEEELYETFLAGLDPVSNLSTERERAE